MKNSKPDRSKYKKVQERRLTVFSKAYARINNSVMVGTHMVAFPEIRIQGKWVQDCGFSIGDSVAVAVKNGVIVIRKVDS